MINLSLTTLAQVINKLAEFSSAGKGKLGDFVPFRNSKLTNLLQESLSGNSKTALIAAVSPALSNFEETMSTLRFAQTCKKVTTKAKKNEESKADMLSDLQRELEELKALKEKGGKAELSSEDKMKELEALRAMYEKDFADELADSKKLQEMRNCVLEDMGLSTDELASAFEMDKNNPQLVNISDDPGAGTGALIYFLAEDEETVIGTGEKAKIQLSGLGLSPFVCSIYNNKNATVFLKLLNSSGEALKEGDPKPQFRLLVNGKTVPAETTLKHQDKVSIGHAYVFRVVVPLHQYDVTQVSAAEVSKGIEDALMTVLKEESDAFIETRSAMDTIHERIGPEKTKDFLDTFTQHYPLVVEGNKITKEVRPQDELRFQLEVCHDMKTYTEDEPELVVRLYKMRNDGEEDVVGIVELPDYVERLQRMRDIHRKHSRDGPTGLHWGFGSDPWGFYSYKELRHELKRLQEKVLHSDPRAGERGIMQAMALAGVDNPNSKPKSPKSPSKAPKSPQNIVNPGGVASPKQKNGSSPKGGRYTGPISWSDSHWTWFQRASSVPAKSRSPGGPGDRLTRNWKP